MYNELKAAYPSYTHFYEVKMSLAEAMDLCARLSSDDEHVVQFGGKIYYTAKNEYDIEQFAPVLPPEE
jgi:hypothetical protein